MIEDKIIYLDKKDIYKYLKNRSPLLMIDNAEVIPGKSSVSRKRIEENEWYFMCHFPGNPLMPGVLQLETIFQTAALAIKTINGNEKKTSNISKVLKASFINPILPGYFINIDTEIEPYRHGIAKGTGKILYDNKIMCEADFILSVPEDMLFVETKGDK